MANKEVKTLTVDNVTYNIKDATARTNISTLNTSVNGLGTRVSALETASANHVTLGTTQTITGRKIFNVANDSPIALKTRDSYTVAPSQLTKTFIGMFDNNGNWVGGWEHYHDTNGDMYKQMIVRQQNGDTYAAIQVGVHSNGSGYTYAPTPAASSNDNNIATTKWVNTKFKYVSSLPATPDSNTFYFIPE